MENSIKMRPLSEKQYGKPKFRAKQAALSYPEKVSSLKRYLTVIKLPEFLMV